MVDINDIPIKNNMRKNFEEFFQKYPVERIVLTDFGKWGGKCAVCGHDLKWAYLYNGILIGRVCSANIIVIQRYGGDIDKVNYDRQVELEIRTMEKKKAEWETYQKSIELEKKYHNEFMFCKKVIDLTMKDNYDFFASRRIISEHTDNRNKQSYDELTPFLYAGQPIAEKGLSEVLQCESWLRWLKQGVVNEHYLQKLRELMNKKSPEQIVEDAKNSVIQYEEYKKEKEKEYDYNHKYFQKIQKVSEVRLNMYDEDFVYNLVNFFESKEYYTEKQRKAIDKLAHKYRKQLSNEVKQNV